MHLKAFYHHHSLLKIEKYREVKQNSVQYAHYFPIAVISSYALQLFNRFSIECPHGRGRGY